MPSTLPSPQETKAAADGAASDESLVARVLAGEQALYELLVRRYNQRLYRIARGILGDEAEAEDVMQDAYVRAYVHLDQFAGRARFSTWLTRIAVHEALARARRRGRVVEMDAMSDSRKDLLSMRNQTTRDDPEQRVIDNDLKRVLETAIENLPETYRIVVVLRDVEGLSTAAAAECLDLEPGALKTRLSRAHALLRKQLRERSREALHETFAFEAFRCDRVVAAVLSRIRKEMPWTRPATS